MNRSSKILTGVMISVALLLGAWLLVRNRQVDLGREAFRKYGCGDCHNNGGGPELSGVTSRYDRRFITAFIQDPADIYQQRQGRSLNPGRMQMPKMGVTEQEAQAITKYLGTLHSSN